jgi:quinol monooxygenase YgiN
MNKTALFVQHKARPGLRDDVRRVWEKHVKPRVQTNLAHEAYYFCYDDNDPDVICVFQLYKDKDSLEAFLAGEWYPAYLREVSQFVTAEPQVTAQCLSG